MEQNSIVNTLLEGLGAAKAIPRRGPRDIHKSDMLETRNSWPRERYSTSRYKQI